MNEHSEGICLSDQQAGVELHRPMHHYQLVFLRFFDAYHLPLIGVKYTIHDFYPRSENELSHISSKHFPQITFRAKFPSTRLIGAVRQFK